MRRTKRDKETNGKLYPRTSLKQGNPPHHTSTYHIPHIFTKFIVHRIVGSSDDITSSIFLKSSGSSGSFPGSDLVLLWLLGSVNSFSRLLILSLHWENYQNRSEEQVMNNQSVKLANIVFLLWLKKTHLYFKLITWIPFFQPFVTGYIATGLALPETCQTEILGKGGSWPYD